MKFREYMNEASFTDKDVKLNLSLSKKATKLEKKLPSDLSPFVGEDLWLENLPLKIAKKYFTSQEIASAKKFDEDGPGDEHPDFEEWSTGYSVIDGEKKGTITIFSNDYDQGM